MPLQLSTRIPEPVPVGPGHDAPIVPHQVGESAQPVSLQGAAVADIQWLPDDVLRQVLDHLDAPSRRSFRSTDRQALRLEDAQRRADRLVAMSRWAGSTARLSEVCDRLTELPVTDRPRVLDAVATRIQSVGKAAMPALRAVIDRLVFLPGAFRLEPEAAAIAVLREFQRSALTLQARDPALERCVAALVVASPGAASPVVPEREACEPNAGEEARLLREEVVAFGHDIAGIDGDAGAWLADWLGRVDALMPPSARMVPLKASALALRYIPDTDVWSAFGRAIAPLSAQARADVLGEVLSLGRALVNFDVVLGLVADLPPSHRDTLLANLSAQVAGASGEEQVARIQALSELAERETGMVFTKTVLSLVMVMDFMNRSGEELVRQHADRVLARLTLSGRAALIAEAACQRTMASRLWALSKLPELAQTQAAHAVAAEPGAGAVIPYRAEIVRRLIVGMTGRAEAPPAFQMGQVWPALCEALQTIEEDATAFPLAALRELAPHLPEPQRAQAYAIAEASTE